MKSKETPTLLDTVSGEILRNWFVWQTAKGWLPGGEANVEPPHREMRRLRAFLLKIFLNSVSLKKKKEKKRINRRVISPS